MLFHFSLINNLNHLVLVESLLTFLNERYLGSQVRFSHTGIKELVLIIVMNRSLALDQNFREPFSAIMSTFVPPFIHLEVRIVLISSVV